MSYRNLHLTPDSEEFKKKYKSVLDAHAQLEIHGEVEVEFTSHNALLAWRRRCYEYQKITGTTFRTEMLHGYKLLLRNRERRPQGDYGMVGIAPAKGASPREPTKEEVHDRDGVVVTEADMELARRVLQRMSETEEVDYIKMLKGGIKGGSHDDTRRPDPGRDPDSPGDTGGSN